MGQAKRFSLRVSVSSGAALALTLSQYSVPFGNRTTGMIWPRAGARSTCPEEEQFTDDEIAFALTQAELGITVAEVCRRMGTSDATFYKWRAKYGGVGSFELRRLLSP